MFNDNIFKNGKKLWSGFLEKWYIKNKDIDFKEKAEELNISPIISKVLINRGVIENFQIKKFLYGGLRDLDSNNSLLGADHAARIIRSKIENNKRIRIVGDYDVDGIMSVYILYKSLIHLGGIVDYVIPNRVDDGYGLNLSLVKEAKEEGIDTIITCDNGISAIEAGELAKGLGLTLIITDHHDLSFSQENGLRNYIYPKADVIVNPKNPECTYEFKYLCGAGVVYRLIEQLFKLYNISKKNLYKLLEYVAIATICDVVDLVDENRIIVKHGLELINKTENIGLEALIYESGIKDIISTYHIGFIIGPTFNASGRLDTAYLSLDLLLEEDRDLAKIKAKELREINEERKTMTTNGLDKVLEQIENSPIKDDKIIVVYEPSIHESIAGIIAGRVKDIYNRPTIVLTDGKDQIKGSARSIEEYNMFEELLKGKDLLGKFGGHPMAAGLSLKESNIDILREFLNNESKLDENALARKVYIDMALPIEYISYKNIEELKTLEPHGKGNAKPIFGDKGLKIDSAIKLGKNKNVLKLLLKTKKGFTIEGLIFSGMDDFENLIINSYGEIELENLYRGFNKEITIDILFYPSINEYMGKTSLQVIIQSFRI